MPFQPCHQLITDICRTVMEPAYLLVRRYLVTASKLLQNKTSCIYAAVFHINFWQHRKCSNVCKKTLQSCWTATFCKMFTGFPICNIHLKLVSSCKTNDCWHLHSIKKGKLFPMWLSSVVSNEMETF